MSDLQTITLMRKELISLKDESKDQLLKLRIFLESENDTYPVEVWFDSRYELDEYYENDCYTAEGWYYSSEITGDTDAPPQHKITKIKIKGFKNG